MVRLEVFVLGLEYFVGELVAVGGVISHIGGGEALADYRVVRAEPNHQGLVHTHYLCRVLKQKISSLPPWGTETRPASGISLIPHTSSKLKCSEPNFHHEHNEQ